MTRSLATPLTVSYTRLRFSPSTLSAGCGLIACGGQSSELALKAAHPGSSWCHQEINSTNGAIHNSIHIAPSPLSAAVPRLYVSNNDETIKVYDVVGHVPDHERARKRRVRRRVGRAAAVADGEQGAEKSEVEEDGVFDQGGPCTLQRVESATLPFDTAINHCSVSPDGRRLVAVGDTNEVHLYDCGMNGSYSHVHTFEASDDASFSTDWSSTGDKFAVASQDGFVNVYDIRSLPPSGRSSEPPRTLATMKATQAGPAGAIRKLKFSPGSRVDSELLAFTEHRSKVHVVDARTFDQMQLLDVPSSTSNVPCPPPRPRPPPSHGITPRAFVDSVYAESGSPEERFMRRLLHDVGSTTQERSRSRGERGWRYVGGEPSSAMDDGWEEDDESEEEEDEEEREEQGRPPIAAGGRRSRLAEDDCPPDSVGADGTSTSISGTLSLANYARILPDPRARPIPPFTASNPRPPPIPGMTTSMILALRSGNRLPTSSLNPTGGGAQVLSGYTPLAAYGLDPTSDWRRELGLGAGVAYEPNSLYFPIESTPSDLLGLDWDEEGTSLFVATEGRVWEWEVDTRARRSFGDWGLR